MFGGFLVLAVLPQKLQLFGARQSQLLSFPACVPSGGNTRCLRLKMLRRRLLSNHLSSSRGRRDGTKPVGASSVQRPSSVRGAPPGETLGIFGGRVSPQLGKGGRPVHNQNFFLLVTPRHDVKKVSPGEKKTGVVNKA